MEDQTNNLQEVEYVSSRKRRGRLGRSSRHRRKKLLQVEAAALSSMATPTNIEEQQQQQEEGTSSSKVTAVTTAADSNCSNDIDDRTRRRRILPNDRDYLWPAIGTLRTLTEIDQQDLVMQLGYLPGNAIEIVARFDGTTCCTCSTLETKETTTSSTTSPTTTDEDPEDLTLAMKSQSKRMSSPSVVKLYPLVIRDEANGRRKTRRRRKEFVDVNGGNKLQSSEKGEGVVDSEVNEKTSNAPQSDSSERQQLVEPFPTIYWVTHPQLKAFISKLELEQYAQELERRLLSDTTALESMIRAHKSYGRERRDMLNADDWKMIQSRHWEDAFSADRGVAGIHLKSRIKKKKSGRQGSNTNSKLAKTSSSTDDHDGNRNSNRNDLRYSDAAGKIKCLHAHAAHYWSGCNDNIVGKWVAERVTQLLKEYHEQRQQQQASDIIVGKSELEPPK